MRRKNSTKRNKALEEEELNWMLIEMKAEDLKNVRSLIYHDELPDNLVERATKLFPNIQTLFTDYSLEDWINGFKYDMTPEREIRYWEEMVSIFQDMTSGKQIDQEETKEIWGKILEEMCKRNPIEIILGGEIPFA